MRCFLATLLGLLSQVWLLSADAAPEFPRLSGRIVDQAGLIDAGTRAELETLLREHEDTTSNQVVVATLQGLQGYDIADYGYQLGRHWGIGQKDKDNGVLLIVAPKERKVRIEVGYGLEGALTDALSHRIIEDRILPRFRNGDFSGGIASGTKAILSALTGTYEATPKAQPDESVVSTLFFILVAFVFLYSFFGSAMRGRSKGRGRRRPPDVYIGGGGFGRGGGFGGGGGGFGGGGGGFGGGGSSGGW